MVESVAILDDYLGIALDVADWSAVRAHATIDVFRDHLDEAKAAELLRPYSALCLMRERMPLPRTLIERLPRLRFIVFSGQGTATLDMNAAAERGITVSRTVPPPNPPSAYVAPAPAEMAWALMMALARNIPREDQIMREGGWQGRMGVTLRGKTLGLVGFGRIGRLVASYGAAFGMKVIAWSANLTEADAASAGARRVDKDELFRTSDFVSLHYTLSARSLNIVGAAEIASMKPSAFLINTARGQLVDETALIAALRERRIAGAGLDVFHTEPLPRDHPLRGLPNVVLTPHVGYVSEEFMRTSYRRFAEAVSGFFVGNPINVVTASDLAEWGA